MEGSRENEGERRGLVEGMESEDGERRQREEEERPQRGTEGPLGPATRVRGQAKSPKAYDQC